MGYGPARISSGIERRSMSVRPSTESVALFRFGASLFSVSLTYGTRTLLQLLRGSYSGILWPVYGEPVVITG